MRSEMKGQIQCRTPCNEYMSTTTIVCSPGWRRRHYFSSRCIFQNGRQLLLVIPNYSDLPKVKFVLCMCFVCLLHILLLYWPFYYILENSDQKKKSNCPYWQIRSQHNHIDLVFLKTNFNVSELSVASLFMGRAPWSFLLKLIGERKKTMESFISEKRNDIYDFLYHKQNLLRKKSRLVGSSAIQLYPLVSS